MFKWIVATLLWLALAIPAAAQNTTCATRPAGDSSNACASTAFVNGGSSPAIGHFTPNLPLIGGPTGYFAQGTRSGNTTLFPTVDVAPVAGNCAVFDSFGGLTNVACSPSGSGTVGAGLTNQIATYPANGTSVVGNGTLPATILTPSQNVSVMQYGALGNSNGTPGNGNDDTSAINAAIAANNPGGIFFPCGTYRITASIGSSVNLGQYHLFGAGQCSKIYLDTATPAIAVNFFSNNGCTNCIEIDHLNFITPRSQGAGADAIALRGDFNARIHDNYFAGYDEVLFLNQSYAPQIVSNWMNAIGGSIIATQGSGDTSLNNGQFIRNAVFGGGVTDSLPAIVFNCGGQLHGQLSIIGNDIETSYAGIELAGCNGVNISNNYIENNTHGDILFVLGFGNTNSSSVAITNNWLGPTTSPSPLGDVTRMTFAGNYIDGWAITWTSTALGVEIADTNTLVPSSGASIGALPTPTISSCGSGPAVTGTRRYGQVNEGSGSVSACTVSFELPFVYLPSCTITSNGGSSGAVPFISAISVNGFSISHVASTGLAFFYNCTSQG